MAESLADDFYATLASVERAQNESGCSTGTLKKRSCSVQPVSTQNPDGNELPFKKSTVLKKRETELDCFGNSTQSMDKQKCEGVRKKENNISKCRKRNLPCTENKTSEIQGASNHERFHRKEKDVSKHSEYNLQHTQDQTSLIQDTSKHETFSRKEKDISKNNKYNLPHILLNEKLEQVGGRRQHLNSGYSAFDDGWQRVPKRKQGKNKNQQAQILSKSVYQKKEESSSNISHKAGESFEAQAGQGRLLAEGLHWHDGSHGSRMQTEEHAFYVQPGQEIDKGMSQQRVERKCGLGYRQLEKLAEDEPYEIIVVLANRRSGFETLLKQPLKPDLLILILRILSKLCKADFEENKAAVLSYACHHDFLDQLSKHIALIPLEVNKRRKENVVSFLEDLMTFLETVINLLPSKAVEGFENIFMMTDMMIKIFEAQQSTAASFDEVKKNLECLKAQYKTCVEDHEKKEVGENTNTYTLEVPQDDFRKISVFPNPEDILAEEPGFVRPNIIDGAYESVYDYLDIQFRLLREDFVSPLREGILEYINMCDKKRIKKISSVRIYRKVFFLNPKIINDHLGLAVCFDPDKHLKRIVWEHSKRFLFGSLLLFSRDNFTNVICATVMDRDIKELKNGKIVVRIGEGFDVSNDLFSGEFVMAESQVYFEPYYHVLKALQNMKKSFPMEKYIIRAQMSDDPPKYMCTEGGALLCIDGHTVSVLKHDSWPGPLELKLDISQYNAFKSALTKEFVVVQGPPGTGKTFLGLKIATVLLKNAPIWNFSRKPILVVCYTNHALDQFLEGLVPVTDKIVRIGGQSKSEILEEFNLRGKRKTHRRQRHLFRLEREIHFRMSDIMRTIKSIQNDMEMIANNRGIISLSVLKELQIIQDQHLSCFASHGHMVSEKLFTEWLEYGMCDDVPPYEAEGNNSHNEGQNSGNDEEAEGIFDAIEGLQRHMLDDLMDWKLDVNILRSRLTFALDLEQLEEDVEWHELQMQYLETQILEDQSLAGQMQMQQEICEDLKLKMNYIKRQLCQEGNQSRRTVQHLLQQVNLWQLQGEERWTLYRYWVDRFRIVLLEELRKLEHNFRCEARMYEEVQQINDLEILKDSLVVGITTTGAARLQSLMQALKAKIVIIEEAAEVMESHIVVSLTHHCEHLILIGDHKQLRPSPAVFRLARDYNFDISLFERMLKNKMHCDVLKVQHRMRPEVANLIVPSIYPELLNHNSVLQYEKIRGMLNSVFFITHNYPEEEVDDTSSHRNTHEGDFLIALCRYLVLQGYSPSRITILAAYSGQLFYLRAEQKKCSILHGVRITVVDNFQGEENDIILLSLVRSNREAKIGFLKIENRVCVALSRAKMGFYIIGNMDNLTRSSSIWPNIKESLKKQEALGTHLTLRCQVHPSVFTRVCTAADFHIVPEGGCLQICGTELLCGHRCKSVCHVRNRDHGNMLCYEPCERVPKLCELQHKCLKLCFEDCGDCRTPVPRTLHCGHSLDLYCYVDLEKYKCKVEVEAELPICGHKVKKPCHMDINLVHCSHLCEDRLLCGHSCILKCHVKNDPDHLEYQCNKPCTRKNVGCKDDHVCIKQCYEECDECRIPFQRKLPHCEHSARVPCCMDPERYPCKAKCSKILPCEHPCPNICSAVCGNCQVKVIKQVDGCGHPLQVKCCEKPDPKMCKSPCKRTLPCGHKCTTLCSVACTQNCLELIPSVVQPACGHLLYISCYMQRKILTPDSEELLSQCKMPCDTLLSCGHRCKGTCGKCMQGRIHKACEEKCGKTLICGHSCDVPCAESCPPCSRKCNYKCKHSKCSRCCGQPCIQCREPCDWACSHRRCRKLCFELCDKEPCNEPCEKLLPCKHPCIGFCGETCPPLCRICNKDEVTEVFFGNEDEPDARFVYLEDCKHVLEATGLEQWMAQSDGEIRLKDCPLCKTPIAKTQRFMNIVKMIYHDVCRVKNRVFGNMKDIEASRDDLKKKLVLVHDHAKTMKDSTEFRILYEKLSEELQPVLWNKLKSTKKLNIPSATSTATLKVQIEIFSQLVEWCSSTYKYLVEESRHKVIAHMDLLLHVVRKREKKISGQEVEDISMEIQRFYRLCQLHKLKSEQTHGMSCSNPEVKKCYEVAHRIAYSIEKFSKERDRELKNALENLSRVMKSGLKITDAERKEIVRGMGYKQGHWYKCPNGHIYIITECGGAMETGQCYECGETIGGSNHRLLSSNRVASEMDGATRPAWPQ